MRNSERPLCRHCNTRKALGEHNGLCQPCHKDKSIRARYPTNRNSDSHGKTSMDDVDRNGIGGEPDEPTKALPGTPEKISVMRQRAEKWQRLHREGDATADEELIRDLLQDVDPDDD